MGARTAERALPPIAHASVWSRACSSVDASTSGRGVNRGVGDEGDALILLSDETAASEAAPLVAHNAVKLAFCGGLSGALAKTCTAPLARLTILYQVRALSVGGPGAPGKQMGLVTALRHVVATEGFRSLWKGNLVTIIHRIPYSAINFWTYEATKKALEGRMGNDMARAWAAGAFAGLVACTAAYPLDLLRTRIAAETQRGAAQQYRRIPLALRRIVSEQGVRGLYKGLGATLAQVVPGLAFNFCFYDTFKCLAMQHQQVLLQHQQLQQQQQLQVQQQHQQRLSQQHHQQQHQQQSQQQQWRWALLFGERRAAEDQRAGTGSCAGAVEPRCQGPPPAAGVPAGAAAQAQGGGPAACPSPLTSAACACAAGLCTSSLTFPLDVVRRRLQVYERGALGQLRYGDVVRAVYAEGGLKAFYRGIGPEFAKVLPGMAIAFTTYEALKRLTGAGQ